jgi:ferredoxin
MTGQIKHDRARCAGLGVCEAIAPEFFEVGGDGEMVVLREEVGSDFETLVREAIDSCPTQALSWSN